jgi:hypothetical protein
MQFAMFGLMALSAGAAQAQPIDPAALPHVATVDERFQSYNVEMVEVTGGRFWKPYRLGPPKDAADRYAYRPPIDLGNKRLRRLAAALGPAYIRVSGTWASATYIARRDGEAAPAGFTTVLTPSQWREMAAFAKATQGKLVLSAPTSPGTRDAAGAWNPAQLEALLKQSRAFGMTVAGVAFMNEPNLIGATGAPADYGVADYARDYARFVSAVRNVAPGTRVLGPGAVGGATLEPLAAAGGLKIIPARDLIAAAQPPVDVYTYHHYGSVSQRCANSGPLATNPADAIDPAWLARTDETFTYHQGLRDQHASGAPIWVTETAQAACGGSPWAATFADTPRYIDQLGRLARAGVAAVFHNTLAASDYALLDERDFSPRPSYWAALLWGRLMGTKVLRVETNSANMRVYAHCLKGKRGGVALVAVNLAPTASEVRFVGTGQLYALAGVENGAAATLNGKLVALGKNDAIPPMKSVMATDTAPVAAAGVSFVALPNAGSPACR